MNDERLHAATLLRAFAANESNPYDLDDFISCRTDDDILEKARNEVHLIPEMYPPTTDSQYTSEDGVKRILEIADYLEASSGSTK